MKKFPALTPSLVLVLVLLSGFRTFNGDPAPQFLKSAMDKDPIVDLSPARWGAGEPEKYLQLDNRQFPDNPMAIGNRGAITTTYHAAASRAGLEALKQGGSSVDAALTAALTQVALNAGAVVSYFGIINMVHYDAASNEIVSMDATWNTVRKEADPMTIPGAVAAGTNEDLLKAEQVSGRTALVGGFMKGVEAAHNRYGKLPFKTLFAPAIYFAERGFKLPDLTASYFTLRDAAIRRLPETQATLVKPGGHAYRAGDVFKQPALAKTLRKVAEQGAAYMYRGPWGKKMVAAVRAEGGKMTLKDLSDYKVIWNEPLRASYGEYELAVLGPPVKGSINLIEAMNLAYAAGLPHLSHWSESGESLRRLSDVTSTYALSFVNNMVKIKVYPGLDLSDAARLKKETAQALWQRIEKGARLAQYADSDPRHSDTVVAIDRWGNMTAITHSINCMVWGATAIMVDGVSIGDPASFQQVQIAEAGPGKRLPSPIELGILLKNGKPVLPFASMATGLHQQTVQSLLNVMAFGMNVKEAVDAPAIFLPLGDYSNPRRPTNTVRVMKGSFPEGVLKSSGLPVFQVPANERRYVQGLWIGIHRDPTTGLIQAASPPYATGRALAY